MKESLPRASQLSPIYSQLQCWHIGQWAQDWVLGLPAYPILQMYAKTMFAEGGTAA